MVPAAPFPDEIATELARLASATGGAAVLLTPAFDIALVRGEMTDEAANLARSQSRSAPSWIGETATFSCDDASWLHVLRITGGWTLGLQCRSGKDAPTIGEELRRSRNTLAILLAYMQTSGTESAGTSLERPRSKPAGAKPRR
jgi:hypothetical protein